MSATRTIRQSFGAIKAAPKVNGAAHAPAAPAAKVEPKPEVKPGKRAKVQAERLPPHSAENEQAAVGCILWKPEESLNYIASKIHSLEEFYDHRNRMVYDTAAAMHAENKPVDMVTLSQRMRDDGTLEQVGGLAYLNEVQDAAISPSNLSYYFGVVQEKAMLRRLYATCTEIAGRAFEHDGDVAELLEQAEREVLALRSSKAKHGSIRDHVHEAIAAIESKFEKRGQILGLPTGFPDLDYYTDGLCSSELIVPAAFPGAGKTSLSMNFVEHAVLSCGHAAAVFSQEMTCRQLVTRMICSTARVNMKQVGRGEIYESDFPKLTGAAGKISASKLHLIEDTENVAQIVAEARRLKQAHDIKLIVVDYLQLVTGGAKGRDANREQEISGVAASLKRLAKELNVPVVAPSQLTDDGKLRESRAIGQHADLVLKMTSRANVEDDCGDGEPVDVFIEKNRNGPSHVTVHLTFLKKWTRFESAAKVSDADVPADGTDEQRNPYND